jgi:hypothetical protein
MEETGIETEFKSMVSFRQVDDAANCKNNDPIL